MESLALAAATFSRLGGLLMPLLLLRAGLLATSVCWACSSVFTPNGSPPSVAATSGGKVRPNGSRARIGTGAATHP